MVCTELQYYRNYKALVFSKTICLLYYTCLQTSVVRIALVIISSRRETVYADGFLFRPRYLVQNVASLSLLLSQRSRNNSTARVTFTLSICSVSDGDLTAEESYLSGVLTLVRFAPISRTTFGPNHDVMAWSFEKEKRDYRHCLHHGNSHKDVDYVLLIEDDAIARPEALDVVERVVLRRQHETNNIRNSMNQNKNNDKSNNGKNIFLSNREKENNSNSSISIHNDNNAVNEKNSKTNKQINDENCYYVKFYHPSRLLGYLSLERERLPQLFAIATVLGTLLYCCCNYLQICFNRPNRVHTSTNDEHRVNAVQHSRFRETVSPSSCICRPVWQKFCRSLCFATKTLLPRFMPGAKTGYTSMTVVNSSRYRWLRCCLFCGFVALLVGRPHMDTAWRRWMSPHLHYVVPGVHCCTQAVLYSRHAAVQLGDYLKRVRCNDTWHKDDAIWAWAQGRSTANLLQNDYPLSPTGLDSESSDVDIFGDIRNVPINSDSRIEMSPVEGYLVQPNVFEHIGLWSSLRNGFIDPRLMRE